MKSAKTSLISTLLMSSSILAQGPVPIGEQFQINSYTTSWQGSPGVAVDSQGSFVVVWSSDGSNGSDTSSYGVQAQRFDAGGMTVGAQFLVNSYTPNGQYTAKVATDPQGNLVVVWSSYGSYGSDTDQSSIQGQRFDAVGAPLGEEFQVNSYTTDHQLGPSIATDSQGNFVVVWWSDGSDGTDTDSSSIQGQRYDSDGVPLGGEFQVNSFTTDQQQVPAVAAALQGNFVVTWRSAGSPGTDSQSTSIQGQRFAASGARVGSQFQVNSYTTDWQGSPAVAIDAAGSFVVMWESNGSFGTDVGPSPSIQGQRYGTAGNRLGGQFQVNTHTPNWQMYPTVAVEADGDFIVAWTSFGQDGSSAGVFGQAFASDGTPRAGEFPVNTYTTDGQYFPAVAVDLDGNLVVVWESVGSLGSDSSNTSIQGQLFSTIILFTDGFESGDISAWTSSVP